MGIHFIFYRKYGKIERFQLDLVLHIIVSIFYPWQQIEEKLKHLWKSHNIPNVDNMSTISDYCFQINILVITFHTLLYPSVRPFVIVCSMKCYSEYKKYLFGKGLTIFIEYVNTSSIV